MKAPFLLALVVLTLAAAPTNPVADAAASVVEVRSGAATGTGFAIADDQVVTAAHVVGGAADVHVVVAGGQRHEAEVTRLDVVTDLAVLTVPPGSGLSSLTLATDPPPLAADVYAASAQPAGGPATISRGIVSGVVDVGGTRMLQADAAINPGSSGGPLLAEDGSVVGVASSKRDGAEGVAYFVPATVLAELLSAGPDGASTAGSATDDRAGAATARDTSPWQPSGWLPLAAPLGVTLAAIALAIGVDRRRRRRPPAPSPFDVDITLRAVPAPVPTRDPKDT